MQVVIDNADLIWTGLKLTLELSVVIIVLGTLFGMLVGIGLLYGNLSCGPCCGSTSTSSAACRCW